MKHLLLGGFFLISISSATAAGKVAEISLPGSTLEYSGSIYFDGDEMIAGDRYDLNSISKITFKGEMNEVALGDHYSTEGTSRVSKQSVNISITAQLLNLSLSAPGNLDVSVYSLNGKRVAKLFSGFTQKKSVHLDLSSSKLARGIYSLVINSNNTQLAQKIVIQ